MKKLKCIVRTIENFFIHNRPPTTLLHQTLSFATIQYKAQHGTSHAPNSWQQTRPAVTPNPHLVSWILEEHRSNSLRGILGWLDNLRYCSTPAVIFLLLITYGNNLWRPSGMLDRLFRYIMTETFYNLKAQVIPLQYPIVMKWRSIKILQFLGMEGPCGISMQ